LHIAEVNGLFLLFYIQFLYQEYGGISRKGVDTMGIDPRLRWRFFSFDSSMPSLPPCDGPAPSNGAGICVNGTAITAAGTHPGAGSNSKIVLLLDDNCDIAVDSVVILLPPSAT
jgi:hypothetical protein